MFCVTRAFSVDVYVLCVTDETMHAVRIRRTGHTNNELTLLVPRKAKIAHLTNLIYENTKVDVFRQRLYYGGKELISEHTIADYSIKNNDVIQLSIKTESVSENFNSPSDSSINTLTESTSNFFKVGDPVDVIYEKLSAWFEARITGIFAGRNQNITEEDKMFQVVMDRDEQTAPLTVRFCDIRPRARYIYSKSELRPGMVVFVNYNLNKPKERGYWYDFEITKVDSEVVGNVIMRGYENVHHCIIKFKEEIMKIESPSQLALGTTETYENIPLRKLPLYCKKCGDVSYKDCKNCSCYICGKKNFIDKLIICDECEYTYHLFCLDPPLQEVPSEPEWYCPDCKTDENEIIKPGENLKNTKLRKSFCDRKSISQIVFGCILGIDVGTCWGSLSEMRKTGIHSSTSNIQGNEEKGVCSILLDKYDQVVRDNGDEFYFTVSQGAKVTRRSINTNISNQLPNKLIRMLATNCNISNGRVNGFGKASLWKQGKPIRIIRSHKMRTSSCFYPETGFRYDGIYKIVEYFPELDSSDYIVWRFLMKRDDPTPPPWINPVSLKSSYKKMKMDVFQLDDRLMKLIDNDYVNEKDWNDCKNYVEYGREAFLEKVKELFSCACCQDIVFMPVTICCKHSFCYECLKNCFSVKIYHCPKCRFQLGKNYKLRINRDLEMALQLLFPGYEHNR